MSTKRLRSVCHSLAHHTVSGLSWLHPHLAQACRGGHQPVAHIDLLSASPYPTGASELQPLRLALRALRDRLEQLLISEGMTLKDLTTASLAVEFYSDRDDYSSTCHAFLATPTGPLVSYAVDVRGNRVPPNSAWRCARPEDL